MTARRAKNNWIAQTIPVLCYRVIHIFQDSTMYVMCKYKVIAICIPGYSNSKVLSAFKKKFWKSRTPWIQVPFFVTCGRC